MHMLKYELSLSITTICFRSYSNPFNHDVSLVLFQHFVEFESHISVIELMECLSGARSVLSYAMCANYAN